MAAKRTTLKKITRKGAEKITEKLIVDLLKKCAKGTEKRKKEIGNDVNLLIKILHMFALEKKLKNIQRNEIGLKLNQIIYRNFNASKERKKYFDIENNQNRYPKTKNKKKV